MQDAKLALKNGSWLLSPAIMGIFPYVEVHDGFRGRLAALIPLHGQFQFLIL